MSFNSGYRRGLLDLVGLHYAAIVSILWDGNIYIENVVHYQIDPGRLS
ncbi:MAG: hypothetical protein OFPII_01820 [Osedax symbiont Rs1]|nr:MAG: hypothetical protein OFPII_01820 [Osedax symbiont Rs1]